MSNSYPRGSEWRKWDMQIHVPGAKHADQYAKKSGNDDWDQFIDLLKNSGVSVFGVTDYFSIDGYVNFMAKIDSIPKLKDKRFFPCIEMRLDISVNSDSEQIQCHLIFDNQYDIEKIQNFLTHLPLKNKKTNNSVAYCTESDITSCGGYDRVSITKEALEKSLKESFGDEKPYLIAGIASGMGSNRANPNVNIKKELADLFDDFCDLFFGNETNTDYYLDEDRCENKAKKAAKKPVLSTSDCHTFDDCQNKSGKRFSVVDQNGGSLDRYGFTWIKSDPTFEGLKQTLWEPDSRVKIQERNPNDEKPGRVVIDKVSYKESNGSVKEVLFNKDLSSIIGTRGSGKSTLLKNIALAVDREQFEDKEKIDSLYPLDDFKVTWGDGNENHGTDQSPKNVFFVPQNYLSLLAYDEAGKARARDEFLTTLLKKNAKFANAIRTYEDFVSDNKVKIEGQIEKLTKSNSALDQAKSQLRKLGSRKEIEEELKTKNEDIKKYKGTGTQALTDDEVKNYTQAKEVVSNDEKKLLTIQQDREILNGLKTSGADVYIANQEISRLSSSRLQLIQSELLKKSKESLAALITAEIHKIDSEIKTLNTNITTNKKILTSLDGKVKANKAIEKLTNELSQLQQTLKAIGELETLISNATADKEGAITALIEAYVAYDKQQAAIFGSIEFDETFSFLQIKIVTIYNLDDLGKFVERNINTVATSPLLKSEDADIRKLHSDKPEKLTSDSLKKYINKLIEGSIKLKVDAKEVGQVISQLLKNRYEIDFLNSVKTKEDGVLFKNMTGGQKAIALLELIFRFDDERYPILIDQPEDDLDVSGVATDLVNFIKSEKSDRQIIVVSHNASLVICADSEEVLVSNCKKLQNFKYDFTYETGAIENEPTRDSIIKVLEGGKDALKQRARKLNFKHEI